MASSKRLRSCSARLSPCSASVNFGRRRRLPVLFDRLLVVAFENQIERGVVVVFGLPAGSFLGSLGVGRIVRFKIGHRDGLT